MTREKWSAVALILIALAMIVGGCTRSDEHKSDEHKTDDHQASGKPSATATTPKATPTTPSHATIHRPSGAPTCRTGNLSVALTVGGAAAGSVYSRITLTNNGPTCVMTGWPGVSYVTGGNGTQLGSPADRRSRATVITLAHHAVAHAQLRETHASTYGSECNIAAADGLRVYPPNNTAAAFIPYPTEGCRSTGVHLMTIGPVRLK